MRVLFIMAALALCPLAAQPGAPSLEEQTKLLAEIRDNALHYALNLPDYICTQVTERRVDTTSSGRWRMVDTIEEQLSFFEHKERYKITSVNNQPVGGDMARDKLGGSTTSGEFGSILLTIFHPRTETEFEWTRWTTIHKRPTHVFTYRVRQPQYQLIHGTERRTVEVGFHGRFLVDRDTLSIMRFEMQCDDIPRGFPINGVRIEQDYDFVEINGQRYVLPAHSEVHSSEGRYLSWNQTSYHHYRKFGADASISFEPADSSEPPAPPKK